MIECRWCGETHTKGTCPKVKAIEFFENGEVKRVEFLTPGDYMPANGWQFQGLLSQGGIAYPRLSASS